MNSEESEESKSKSEEEKEEKEEKVEKKENVNEEEEQEEEQEQEENQEEEVEEEVEHINVNEIDNSNTFIISLQLIKKFDNMEKDQPESIIIDFLKNVGLPMHFNNDETLSLYLYFHKMCIPFYKLLKNIKSEKVSEIVLNALKESYYLLADNESKHYNYADIAKKSFQNLRISEEDTNISKVPIVLQNVISKKSSDLQIRKLILDLGFNSHGRLDVYVKIHIMKAIIIYPIYKFFNKWKTIYLNYIIMQLKKS